MEYANGTPGFYGKLPSHGDFVGRRLPLAVQGTLDHWLQAALLQSRADLGEAWLDAWLNGPLWRFVVGQGVCDALAWGGVMMPSHDRVGRCFPLLLAAGIDGTPSPRACMTELDAWFARLEDLALSTLDEGFMLENLDLDLRRLAPPRPADAAPEHASPTLARDAPMVEPLRNSPLALAELELSGRSAWWTGGSVRVAPCLAVSVGLPAPDRFAALLDGRWDTHGWQHL